MKNLILILTLCLSIAAFGYNYEIYPTPTPPTIDGVIDPAEWASATTVYFEVAPTGDIISPSYGSYIMKTTPGGVEDFSLTYYIMYDEDYLYIAADVKDDDLANYGYYPVYQGDTIIFGFNPFNDPEARFQIEAAELILGPAARNYEGGDDYGAGIYKKEGYLNSFPNAIVASTDSGTRILVDYGTGSFVDTGDTGWMIEAALPWSDISPNAGLPGTVHGVFLGADDMDWNAIDNGYGWDGTFLDITGERADISNWNTITLIGDDGCGVLGIDAGDVNHDCQVDILDFAALAENWLKCSDPILEDCVDAR